MTILDDHSRYSIGLRACANECHQTVQDELITVFRRYGMPRRMLMDNGAPWGDAEDQPWTRLTVWLLQVGVAVSHGRAYHPQTQGKEERFHRTLKAEVLRERSFCDVHDCQRQFDPWRREYNHERPQEALGLAVPSSRYQASQRRFPEVLPTMEYGLDQAVRRVQQGNGRIAFERRTVRIGKAFCGELVGVRPTSQAGVYRVYCRRLPGVLWRTLRGAIRPPRPRRGNVSTHPTATPPQPPPRVVKKKFHREGAFLFAPLTRTLPPCGRADPSLTRYPCLRTPVTHVPGPSR